MASNGHPPPFPPTLALVNDSGQHLPGEPRVILNDRNGVNTFLYRELETPLFDELYPWCEVLASKRGDNISSLHRQRIKGREIVPSEDPRLHMVWDKHKFYVKPIPACLLSCRVWETFLSGAEQGQQRREIALGFLRSYAYLIRHASDLRIAREAGLLPELDTPITWTRWALFIACFQAIPDSEVSRRYHFGHLRLGRLDWAVRMRFMGTARLEGPRWYYLQPYWSIPVLLEDMFNYFLFAFAMASLLLSAMQVSLAIPPGAYTLSTSLHESGSAAGGEGGTIPGGSYIFGMWRFFWVFANATIYLCGFLCLGMLCMLAYPYLKKIAKVVVRGIWRRRGGKGE
ncbi:hypothetical protein V8F20_008119 [Naviculisporaceae sp. PSN 640]